jgi:hypothetical protein
MLLNTKFKVLHTNNSASFFFFSVGGKGWLISAGSVALKLGDRGQTVVRIEV